MIENQEIIGRLARLAQRLGTTKAEALKLALQAEAGPPDTADANLFPRDRVEYRTIKIR